MHDKVILEDIISEKGEKGTKGEVLGNEITWEKRSLFRAIIDLELEDDLDKNEIEYFICDDMGLEIADFVLCTMSKVIFIHAKYGSLKTTTVSASKLQDVCGQAIKNIFYISPYNHIIPKGVNDKWYIFISDKNNHLNTID